MHVILVYSYLQKCHLVPLADFQTYFFYLFIYRLTKHHSSILCWTYHIVYQHRNIMTLMYVFTHTYNIPFSTQQAAGNLPEELLKVNIGYNLTIGKPPALLGDSQSLTFT